MRTRRYTLMQRLAGERRAHKAFARLARRLRRPHHDAESRRRRGRAADRASRNPRRGVYGRFRHWTSTR